MTSPEGQRPTQANGKEVREQLTPAQLAERAFTTSLMSGNHPGELIPLLNSLHNTHLDELRVKGIRDPRSVVPVFDRTLTFTDQAIQKAEVINEDMGDETVQELRSMREGFEITREFFAGGIVEGALPQRPAVPTPPESLPPMTSAKGGETTLYTGSRQAGQRKQTAQPAVSTQTTPSAPEGQQSSEAGGQEVQVEENFAGYLKQLRAEHNITQKALGERVGKTNLDISQFERGLKRIPSEMVDQFIEALGLDDAQSSHLRELYDKQNGKKTDERK